MAQTYTEIELKYLDLAWSNIRHNETLRNTFFSLYLIISSIFLLLIEKGPKHFVAGEVMVVVGLFIWIIGVLFLWSFVRLKAMIDRDSDVAQLINEIILKEHQRFIPVLERHATFRRIYNKKGLRRIGTVSTCVIVATVLIAAFVGGAGLWQFQGGGYAAFSRNVLGFVLLNAALLGLVAWRWGQKQDPGDQI